VRRHAKASSAGSIEGAGKSRGPIRRSVATRGASSESRGSGARSIKLLGLLALATALLALAAASASAKTTNQYLSQIDRSAAPGGGTNASSGVAVASSGDVYVAAGQRGIEHYSAAGAYLGQIDGSATPRGEMSGNGVAVAPNGDLYVSDAEGGVVDRFDASGTYLSQFDGSATPEGAFNPGGVAVAADGHVFVTNYEVLDEFDASGTYVRQFTGAATPQGYFCSNAPPVLAADGRVYVVDPCHGVVDEFDAAGAYVSQIDGTATPQGFFSPAGGTIGANGHLYVGDRAGLVDEFDASGTYIRQFDGATTPRGAFSPGESEQMPVVPAPGASLYVEDAVGHTIDKFSEALVVVPDAITEGASALEQTTATISGTVNPDATATTYQFEWGTDTSYGNLVPDPAASAGSAASGHLVSADLTGLLPNTTYHYRLKATNANATSFGPDQEFITPAPPTISAAEVSNGPTTDGTTEADLKATINPNGADTAYHFEYGPDSSYGTVMPVPDADVGSGRSGQTVGVHITGLQPETIYHYRVVAHSTVGTTETLDLTFRTAGGPFPLPDNRAWEQVTPVNKRAVNVEAIEGVSGDGDSLAFGLQAALAGSEVLRSADSYVVRRTDAGWVTAPMSLPARLSASGSGIPEAYSADLGKSLLFGSVQAPGTPPASTGTISDARRLFMVTLPDDPYAPPVYAVAAPDLTGHINFLGSASDLSTLVFRDDVQPTGEPLSGQWALYEIAETERGAEAPLRRVDVDNAGVPISSGVIPRSDGFNAVSHDGSRVFFTAAGAEHIYARTDGATTTAISDPSPSECDPSCAHPAAQAATFYGASEEGSRAYFTTTQELVAADTDTTADLYEYDFSEPAGHHIIQVSGGGSGDAMPGSGAKVLGMVRLADDGSRAAFVAQGVLTTDPNSNGDQAVAGAANLYVVERQQGGEGTTKFVGTVPSGESVLWSSADTERPAQASSTDGRYLAFATHAQLTDDDTDSAQDVYRFDDESGELVRVSHGQDGYNDDGNDGRDATITAPAFGNTTLAARNRAISDDGATIAFHTSGSLQPVDQNNKPNVYEWRDGAVTLIGDPLDPSNKVGSGPAGVGILSRSGEDLFTLTSAALVPQDTDGTVRDVYDARVGGGFPFTPPSACDALTDSCRASPVASPRPPLAATMTVNSRGDRARTLTLGKVSAAAQRKFAATGKLALKVSASEGGWISAKASARIAGKSATVGSAGARLTKAGTVTLRIKLSRAARKQLAADGSLTVKVVVGGPGVAGPRSLVLALIGGR
jgi:hypothetical protein